MVVLPGGGLALGRYEVTVAEYRTFASATGRGAGGGCQTFLPVPGQPVKENDDGSWQDPGFAQTDRHPVTCVSWHDALAYASWLSRTTGAPYRLQSDAEWDRAIAGSQPGCYRDRTGRPGTCPVGSHGGVNPAGVADMAGNVAEWTRDCWQDDCTRRVTRGGSWFGSSEGLRPPVRFRQRTGLKTNDFGFRVSRRLD